MYKCYWYIILFVYFGSIASMFHALYLVMLNSMFIYVSYDIHYFCLWALKVHPSCFLHAKGFVHILCKI